MGNCKSEMWFNWVIHSMAIVIVSSKLHTIHNKNGNDDNNN